MQTAGSLPLGKALFPRAGVLGKTLLVVGFSLATAAAAQISVELPFSPVPIAASTLMVLLAGMLLGSKLGASAMLLYIGYGLAGLPVFAGGLNAWSPVRAGVPTIIGPTAGYLVGYVVAAFAVGWLAERGWDRKVLTTAAAMIIGTAIIYAFGLINLARFVPGPALLGAGLLPFLPGDALKVVIATVVLPGGWKVVQAFGLNVPR